MDGTADCNRHEALLAAVQSGAGAVWLVVHDYPDPDCLAGALGMQTLLATNQIPAVIAHGGVLGRAENKAMAGLLEIELHPFAKLNPRQCRGAVLIDTQPGAGNNSLPPNIPVLGVIDHHDGRSDHLDRVPFVDIRTDYHASSTIVHEYLSCANVNINPRVATALYLGIKTDTDSLEGNSGPADVEAYGKLLPRVDLPLLRKITHAPLPVEYYAYLRAALNDACQFGEAVVATAGPVETPDFLSAVSDLLIQVKDAAWVLVLGWWRRKVYLSLRIRPPRRNAASIIRKTVADVGRGGGHGISAGGQIAVHHDDDCEHAAGQAALRFLQAVEQAGEPARRFCRRKGRQWTKHYVTSWQGKGGES